MRKHDQEIEQRSEIESVLNEAMVCRIGMVDHDYPYVVPVCFGYSDGRIYIHSSQFGKKTDLIKQNNKVCFEVDVDVEIVEADLPCKWSVKYRSVIGFGKAHIVDDPDEKTKALNVIMEHYSGESFHQYDDAHVNLAAIIKIEIENMTGKRSKEGGG
jgi:nitroimidazol reductase NimA-like FMN-containing flavoprotein (pyridoxamine 5'-phosphate oxidase superfamily)